MSRVLWGLVLVDISSIPVGFCDINVSYRTTAVLYEDKLIWFIACYIVDMGYESDRHRNGVPTPSVIFFLS